MAIRSIQRRCFLGAALGMAGLAGVQRASVAEGLQTGWKAGVARRAITPGTSVWLAGYGTRRAPEGKLHELWMKALALQTADSQPAVLITSDFQGVPRSMSNRVFSRLQQELGLERRQIMFTFSHNHCGPRLGDDLIDYYPVDAEQEKLVADYTDQMVEEAVAMVREALADLVPVTLRHGTGKTDFAVNRRNNREADVAELLARGEPLAGPVDHAVPVLHVATESGRSLAVLFGYACHPTTLSFTTWCGDYPGFAQLQIEQQYPGTTAMFVNTCGGDQNPLPRRKVELCERYGRMLADAVAAVLQQPLQPVQPALQMSFQLMDLPYLEVVDRAQLQELLQDSSAIKARWAERLLKQLDNGGEFETGSPYPLHAWKLGEELLWIGMGAETVVDYALRFKLQYGPGTWVMGYTDDMLAYIPSRRVWEEGGYEGGSFLYEYGRPAFRWRGDLEDRIAAEVDRLVRSTNAGQR